MNTGKWNLKSRFQVSGVGKKQASAGSRVFTTDTSYETTPKWHGFLMIRLAASMAWIKHRTAEYRISNFEGWNRSPRRRR